METKKLYPVLFNITKLVQRKRRLLHIRKQRQFYTPLLNPESNAPPKVRALSKMLLHQLY